MQEIHERDPLFQSTQKTRRAAPSKPPALDLEVIHADPQAHHYMAKSQGKRERLYLPQWIREHGANGDCAVKVTFMWSDCYA